MFSRGPEGPRKTAAWRLSIGMTLAFAVGTALAFAIMYHMVGDGIRQRADAWLIGEAEVLASVAINAPSVPGANAPKDNIYNRIVEEVAELAAREVGGANRAGDQSNAVFFLDVTNGNAPVWVGPEPNEMFLDEIARTHFDPGVPRSIVFEGATTPFRVVKSQPGQGGAIYLGLSDRVSMRLLDNLSAGFLLVWVGMVLLGFVIAYTSAYRMLNRVEKITETAARIGVDDFESRLPEAKHFDEISRLSQTFNRMLDRIQASVSQLRTVTDALAHDLKSPVTSIRGRLEAALSNRDDTSWREPVAEAIEGLDRMSQFLNTTLDLAEADGGALHLERTDIDMSLLVRQLVDLYQPALAEHRHEVTTSLQEHIAISGDVSLINRVVGNLLDNELIHLPEGRNIAVRLERDGKNAQLKIEDNGPGFPQDLRGRALERFAKGKGSPGHGLGLAFVDAVARAHGGGVIISGSASGGALITLSLPLAAVSTAAAT